MPTGVWILNLLMHTTYHSLVQITFPFFSFYLFFVIPQLFYLWIAYQLPPKSLFSSVQLCLVDSTSFGAEFIAQSVVAIPLLCGPRFVFVLLATGQVVKVRSLQLCFFCFCFFFFCPSPSNVTNWPSCVCVLYFLLRWCESSSGGRTAELNFCKNYKINWNF